MTDEKRPQEREFVVHDRPTETGVKINNVLTGLLLAAALWVGSSVEDLKEAVIVLATQQEHNEATILDIEDDIKDNRNRIRVLERYHPEFFNGAP